MKMSKYIENKGRHHLLFSNLKHESVFVWVWKSDFLYSASKLNFITNMCWNRLTYLLSLFFAKVCVCVRLCMCERYTSILYSIEGNIRHFHQLDFRPFFFIARLLNNVKSLM